MMTETLADIVSSIWSTVLGLPVVPAAMVDDRDADEALGADCLTACVQISGAWSGVVQVSFPPALSVKVASAMLNVSEGDTTPDDARDCLTELVNMIGGNLKATLPAPSSLSLPWVTDGHDHSVALPHRAVTARLPLESAGERMLVTVITAGGSPGAAEGGGVAN